MAASSTSSFRIPLELARHLSKAVRQLGRTKNSIIVEALEEYLAKVNRRALVDEARRQSLRASAVSTEDEALWQSHADANGWR